MPLLLYTLTALALLALVHWLVRPISWPAAVVLLALPLAFVGYALITGGVYGPIDHPYQSEPLAALKPLYGIGQAHNVAITDTYAQMFPWRRAVQASLERGEWPLWNPYELCGHLLAGSLQSAPYNPFTLLACLLPAAQSFTFTAAIALFIAATSAFLFARELDCSEAASLIAAAGWAFASSTLIYIETALGFASIYTPLVFAAARRVVRTPSMASGAFLCAALVLPMLAGHPESLFLIVLTASIYALFELIRLRTRPWRAIGVALIAGTVALLICAIYLLPFFEAVPQSGESEYKNKVWANEPRAATNDRVLAALATDLFPYLHVRRWLSPALGLTQAETATAGSLILALAVFALWHRRSAETWFFAILGACCWAIELRWAPFVAVLQKLPLLKITHHERLGLVTAMLLCILAAIGADAIPSDRRRAAIAFALVLLVLAGGTWWLTHHVTLAIDPADWGELKIFAEIFFLGVAALLVVSPMPPRFVLPSLLALIVAQRAMSDGGMFKTFPAAAAYPPIAIFEPLKKITTPFRIVGQSFALIPETSTFYGLEDARGFEALTHGAFVKTWPLWCRHQPIWFNRVDDITVPFLSFLNVRFAIVSDRAPVPDGWRNVAQQRGAALLENTRVIERVFIPRRVRVGPSAPEAVVAEMAQVTDFRDVAWITATADQRQERENGPGTVRIVRRSPGGKYDLDVAMQRDGWIVISDTGWKGWRAYIDGRRVQMQPANAAFLSVYVPQGRHAVRVVYWPESFVRGRAITFTTLIVIALIVLLRVARLRGFEVSR